MTGPDCMRTIGLILLSKNVFHNLTHQLQPILNELSPEKSKSSFLVLCIKCDRSSLETQTSTNRNHSRSVIYSVNTQMKRSDDGKSGWNSVLITDSSHQALAEAVDMCKVQELSQTILPHRTALAQTYLCDVWCKLLCMQHQPCSLAVFLMWSYSLKSYNYINKKWSNTLLYFQHLMLSLCYFPIQYTS